MIKNQGKAEQGGGILALGRLLSLEDTWTFQAGALIQVNPGVEEAPCSAGRVLGNVEPIWRRSVEFGGWWWLLLGKIGIVGKFLSW